MPAIGFRADAEGVWWAVVGGTSDSPNYLSHDYIAFPVGSNEAPGLAFVRQRVIFAIRQHKPEAGFVRFPEGNRGKKNQGSVDARLRVEGVLLEALHSHGVKASGGPLGTITALMSSDSAKAYIKSDEIRGLKYPNKNESCREAIVAAVSVLEKL